jgi:hypothetical protein
MLLTTFMSIVFWTCVMWNVCMYVVCIISSSFCYNNSLFTLYFPCQVSPCPILRTFLLPWFCITSACCLHNFVNSWTVPWSSLCDLSRDYTENTHFHGFYVVCLFIATEMCLICLGYILSCVGYVMWIFIGHSHLHTLQLLSLAVSLDFWPNTSILDVSNIRGCGWIPTVFDHGYLKTVSFSGYFQTVSSKAIPSYICGRCYALNLLL